MASFNIGQIVTKLRNARLKRHEYDSISKHEDIKALTEAVTFISTGKGILGTEPEIVTVFEGLVQGDTGKAYALLYRARELADTAS